MKRTLWLLLFLCLALTVALGIMRTDKGALGLGIYPEIVEFKAEPPIISQGGAATIRWNTRGTTGVRIEAIPEDHPDRATLAGSDLPSSGSMSVKPAESTTYILRCDTVAGAMCLAASASVRVR